MIHVLFSGLLSGLCCYWSLSLQVCSNLPWSVSGKGSPWETIKLQPFSPPSVTAGGGKNSAPSVKTRESEYLSRDSAGTQLKCAFSTVAKERSVATLVHAGADTAKGPPGGAGSTFTARVTEPQRTRPFTPSSQCISVWLPSPSDLQKRDGFCKMVKLKYFKVQDNCGLTSFKLYSNCLKKSNSISAWKIGEIAFAQPSLSWIRLWIHHNMANHICTCWENITRWES